MTLAPEATDLQRLPLRYAQLLDQGRYEEWLSLFTDSPFYGVLPRRIYEQGSKLMVVNDAGNALRKRVEQFQSTYASRMLHCVTNVDVSHPEPGRTQLSWYVTIYVNGKLDFVGQVLAELTPAPEGKIQRLLILLDSEPVGIIQMPI